MRRGGLLMLFAAVALSAANFDELKRNCEAMKDTPGAKTTFSCLSSIFTENTLHPIVRNIVPGGGTGVGLAYKLDRPGDWHKTFTVNGAMSFRAFWTAETKFGLRRPNLAAWNKDNEDYAFHAYLRARGLPQMTYYGLGPTTRRDNIVNFAERDVMVGGDASIPVAPWLGVGGVVEGIIPEVTGVTGATVRSISSYFSDATAPGLATQPNFLHTEMFVRPHHNYPFEVDGRVGYHFFQSTGGSRYSFQRFRADMTHNIYPERIRKGRPKRDSVLSIRGVVSLSHTSADHSIPFYLQETLGGSDINGVPTLRGFADYRFRAPNLFLIQTQYERRIWQYFGLLGFYDTGQVAMKAGDLGFGNMRHSFGFGVSFWAESKVVFRAYIGLGSGEGRHNYFGIPAALP